MIRVCSRTGRETTLHEEISLGELMSRFFIFKAHVNMPKIHKLLNVCGFFYKFFFFYKKCNKQRSAACCMMSNEEVSYACCVSLLPNLCYYTL